MKKHHLEIVVPGIFAAGALALAVGVGAQDHPGREDVLGTVVRVADQRLEVRTPAGDLRVLELSSQTRYLAGDAEASPSDLRPGTRVAVEAEDVSGRWVARFVRIGVQTPAPPGEEQRPAPHHGAAPEPAHERSAHPAPSDEHAAGSVAGAAEHAAGGGRPGRTLFQSDMTMMAGMSAEDPGAAMPLLRWQWMTMGVVRLVYNRQGGPSGAEEVESTNWAMVMGQRDVGRGRLTLMLMSSLEPTTLDDRGSPQLFQTGETFSGRPLVDRQHPHDFFMNLSATYRLPLGDEGAAWVQAALRGEPALGPTVFMHRASAGENPAAVLGHHFQDSTHITDSVATIGVGWRRLAFEASAFHGAEPDEGRWDLDPGALDSWSARLKLQLGAGWTGQVSHGFLAEPEALEPGDVRRTTASLHWGERGDRPFAASLVWGRNREEHGTFQGFAAEAAYQLTRNDHVYARAEQVDREVALLQSKGAETGGDDNHVVEVRAFTLGYLRELVTLAGVERVGPVHFGLGADLTLYDFPLLLDTVYGDSPLSVHVFLRLRWGAPHGGHGGHGAEGAARGHH